MGKPLCSGGGGSFLPPTSRGLGGLCVQLVVVQGGFAGGDFREVSATLHAGAEVLRGGEVVATDDEGEALAHLEEGLGYMVFMLSRV